TVAGVLGNPYDDEQAHAAAWQALEETQVADLSAAASALESAGKSKELRRLLLALGLLELRGGRSPLEPAQVPESRFAVAGSRRDELQNVLVAAVRCREKLDRIAGSSVASVRLRAETWRVCFASSLDDALRLQSLIRQQNVFILGETGTGKELVAEAIAAGA